VKVVEEGMLLITNSPVNGVTDKLTVPPTVKLCAAAVVTNVSVPCDTNEESCIFLFLRIMAEFSVVVVRVLMMYGKDAKVCPVSVSKSYDT
jgi:hypothetical protein